MMLLVPVKVCGSAARALRTVVLEKRLSFGTNCTDFLGQKSLQTLPSGPLVLSFAPSWIFSRNVQRNSLTLTQARSIHSDQQGSQRQSELPPERRTDLALPPLMESPYLMWPKFMNTVRNFFFVYFVIKPYFDPEFSIHDFMRGANEAVSLVATKMADGEFDDLEGLVDPKVLRELRQTVSTWSVLQQELLRVASKDIFFSFPYQIGIIIPESWSVEADKRIQEGLKPPPQTRHVEITVVLHVLRGMEEMKRRGRTGSNFSFMDFSKDPENRHSVQVVNYRFFRDFTEGADPTWVINLVNHFLPAEMNKPPPPSS